MLEIKNVQNYSWSRKVEEKEEQRLEQRKFIAWNFISWELYIKLYLFNEVDTRKMYRTCQTPSTSAFWEKDNIWESDHSLSLLASFPYLLVLRGIINERAGGTTSKIMKNTQEKKNCNIVKQSKAKFIDLTTT